MQGITMSMKPIMVLGISLTLMGIVAFSYQGITYKTHEKVLEIGPIEATVEKEKTILLPPMLGGLALAGGVVLIAVAAMKSRS
jgi:hypothetical protein